MTHTLKKITEDAKIDEKIIQQKLTNLTALLRIDYEKQGDRVIEMLHALDQIAHVTYTELQKDIIKQTKEVSR